MNISIDSDLAAFKDNDIRPKEFHCNNPMILILSDNIFYGDGLSQYFQVIAKQNQGATVLGLYF